jgi:hypothetical protein
MHLSYFFKLGTIYDKKMNAYEILPVTKNTLNSFRRRRRNIYVPDNLESTSEYNSDLNSHVVLAKHLYAEKVKSDEELIREEYGLNYLS